MGLDIHISNAESENPDTLRRVAAALLVLADAELPPIGVQPVTVTAPGTATVADEQRADPFAPPAPSSANVSPPPTAPGAIGAAPPPPVSAPPAPTDASETSDAPTDAAPSTPAPEGERDKHGFLWDSRIHSSSKVKNADGSWRLRRGVAPATVDKVVAELRAGVAATFAPPPPAAADTGAAPPPPAADTQVAPPPPAAANPAPPPPGATPQPNVTIAPVASAVQQTPYISLVMDVADSIAKKTLTGDESRAAFTSLGLAELADFNKHPELMDSFRALLAGKLNPRVVGQ